MDLFCLTILTQIAPRWVILRPVVEAVVILTIWEHACQEFSQCLGIMGNQRDCFLVFLRLN
jgi:hypothetical protein